MQWRQNAMESFYLFSGPLGDKHWILERIRKKIFFCWYKRHFYHLRSKYRARLLGVCLSPPRGGGYPLVSGPRSFPRKGGGWWLRRVPPGPVPGIWCEGVGGYPGQDRYGYPPARLTLQCNSQSQRFMASRPYPHWQLRERFQAGNVAVNGGTDVKSWAFGFVKRAVRSTKTQQESQCLLSSGWYASCSHAGGLSCCWFVRISIVIEMGGP